MKLRYLFVVVVIVIVASIVIFGTQPRGKAPGELEGQTTPNDIGRGQ